MPFSFVMPASAIPPPPKLSEQNALYGRDVAFNGDFTATPSQDWKTIEGPEALRQSIYRRLLTLPGEYRPYPDYGAGVRAWVKRTNSKSSRDQLEARIRGQLLQDPRITKVLEVRLERPADDPGRLQVIVRVLALGNELRYGPFDFAEVA